MNIQSPAEWLRTQSMHWDSMPAKLKNIIAFCALELAVLGVMALYIGGM
jgi:hypothetical protein